MPGISDRRALRNTIIDSLSVPQSTLYRLKSRGLKDAKSAMRLRRTEVVLFSEWEPQRFSEVASEAKSALVEKRAGNYYYYKFALFLMNRVKDKDFIIGCRSSRTLKQFNLATKLLEVKLPPEEYKMCITSLPEGYQRIHNVYIAFRSFYDQLMGMYSSCGRNRGKLQAINTKNKEPDEFKVKLLEWVAEESAFLKRTKKPSSYSDEFKVGKRKVVEMVRISDLIYLKLHQPEGNEKILLTFNHFERCTNLIKQISNILLGSLLAYGQEGNYSAEEVVSDIVDHLKSLYKIGVKDDLAVGEAGKSVTDLFKAKLSQTDELPWNNFKMLMNTYSEERAQNAAELWSDFRTLKHDPDVMLNISYVWKTAAQPDSSIRKDFIELTEGLGKPNPVAPDAPMMIEVAIRRAVLVGAIKENRQVAVTPEPGYTMSPELQELVSHSFPNDRHVKLVTHGMMKGMRIYVPNVFPNPYDVSHLMFKDKSSAVSDISIRKKIEEKSQAELEIEALEDASIMEHAQLAAENFLSAITADSSKSDISWCLRSTANDILTSLDEQMSEVFLEADKKFKLITKSLAKIRDQYGGSDFTRLLKEWAKENPELLINTATEPKYGEVHKRSVRIFYMFEKGMKSFLSQFERIARIVGYYIKGAEIVKGDRARETHMNVLSSAHRAGQEGVLAYQILFDLSKFSQKFNHKIIDAATKVIGELVGYPEYSQLSDLFKVAFLFVSARNVDHTFVGVLGAFEGFLNFLWTNIHATVMDIALRNCGRSGDLAAYSDDGLLMFTMNAKPDDPHEVIQKELTSIINSIKATYTDFGLDFNLGKTLISRNLAEFLGIVQYKGHRFPTWMKELCHLGVPDDVPLIRSIGQEITDVSSQMSALIKAGMPAFSATFVGYLELFMGPCRRIIDLLPEVRSKMGPIQVSDVDTKVAILILCLNQAFGGVRVPDPFTVSMTSDFDPTSEMLFDIENYLRVFPDASGVIDYIVSKVQPTNDYTSLFLGAAPVHTEGVKYSTGNVRSRIGKEIKKQIKIPEEHPLSRNKTLELHLALEGVENIYLPSITSLTRYIVPSIMYEKALAPTKSSSVARLLSKVKIRSIQKFDTTSMKDQIKELITCLAEPSTRPVPSADYLYSISFPNLSIAPSLPSTRKIASFSRVLTHTSYEVLIRKKDRLDNKGSKRFLNQNYYDDLVPPLVTTDVNIQHLMSAPDLVTHCIRGVYAELIASSSQGHDLSYIVQAICNLNKCPLALPILLTSLQDMRKIAVANRKKSIHRVYWSEAVKNAISIIRMGELNHYMSMTSNFHYSLIVTSVLARVNFILTGCNFGRRGQVLYYDISPELVQKTKLLPMKCKPDFIKFQETNISLQSVPPSIVKTIEAEVMRSIDNKRQELVDNLLIGRMGMLPDFQRIGSMDNVLDPLRYAIVWSIISKIDSTIDGTRSHSGVSSAAITDTPNENIPIELVNLAMIYRSYRNVRKSELNTAMKVFMNAPDEVLAREDSGIMPRSIAEETIYAANQLGLMNSLDVKSLSSAQSALIYNSMLLADSINMVYYSLDTKAETSDSLQISPARVSAMKRIVEALISRMFLDKNDTLEKDLCKILMMIIKACMRGSVHRSRPYNSSVVSMWIHAFFEAMDNYMSRVDGYYWDYASESNPKYKACNPFTEEMANDFENYLKRETFAAADRDLGTADQFNHLISFLRKAALWGYLPIILVAFIPTKMDIKVDRIYDNIIRPAIMMARTVSYNTVNKVLCAHQCNQAQQFIFQNSIEQAIEFLTTGTKGDETYEDYLKQPPNESYRQVRGPLYDLRIMVYFPPDCNLTFGPALAYSLALPLLFASGNTAFKSISVLGQVNPAYYSDLYYKSFAELSLPFDPEGIPMAIIQGLSERDVWFSLTSWAAEKNETSLICVEIPPDATLFSLGVIGFLTSRHYSYATVAMSSDLQGASIYVVAIISGDVPAVKTDAIALNSEVWSLGDGAISHQMHHLNHGDTPLLSSLYLNPMHQAGIPIYSHYHCNGKILALSVEEELLDRHRVSFVQTTKPSKTSEMYANLDYEVSSMIIRVHRMKDANNPPFINLLAAVVYYIKAIYKDLELHQITDFIMSLFNTRESESDQLYLMKHLAAPIVSMREINPASFPTMAQLMEPDIPMLDLGEVEEYPEVENYSRSIIHLSGVELLTEEEKGLLWAYLTHNRTKLNIDDAWASITSERPAPVKRSPKKYTLTIERRVESLESSSEAQLLQTSVRKPTLKFLERADVIETKQLFQGTFGEAIFEKEIPDPTSLDYKRERIRKIMIVNGWDEFTLEIVDRLSEDEVNTLNEMGDDDVEAEIIGMADEKRRRMGEVGGVI